MLHTDAAVLEGKTEIQNFSNQFVDCRNEHEWHTSKLPFFMFNLRFRDEKKKIFVCQLMQQMLHVHTYHTDHHEIMSERNATFFLNLLSFLPYDTTRSSRRQKIATSRDDLIYVITDFRRLAKHKMLREKNGEKSHMTNDDVIWPQSSSCGKLRELAQINENKSLVSE